MRNAQAENTRALDDALSKWRIRVLAWLANEMCEGAAEYRDAAEGLDVAYRNPGQVAEDVINILWDKLNDSAVLVSRLERVSISIQEMELPHLIVLFQRTNKARSWPWEGERWELPPSMF